MTKEKKEPVEFRWMTVLDSCFITRPCRELYSALLLIKRKGTQVKFTCGADDQRKVGLMRSIVAHENESGIVVEMFVRLIAKAVLIKEEMD